MGELGETGKELHYETGAHAGDIGIDLVCGIGEDVYKRQLYSVFITTYGYVFFSFVFSPFAGPRSVVWILIASDVS